MAIKKVVSKWAIIANNKVQNIVEWDGVNGEDLFPSAQLYNINDSDVVGVGYISHLNEDGNYTFYPPEDYNTVY